MNFNPGDRVKYHNGGASINGIIGTIIRRDEGSESYFVLWDNSDHNKRISQSLAGEQCRDRGTSLRLIARKACANTPCYDSDCDCVYASVGY
jgi:hypothetical protein